MNTTTRIITAIHAAAFAVSLSFILTSPVWAFVMSWGYLALFVTVALVVMALAAPVACGMDTDRINRLWILSRYHGAELATLEQDVVKDVNTLHRRCDTLDALVTAQGEMLKSNLTIIRGMNARFEALETEAQTARRALAYARSERRVLVARITKVMEAARMSELASTIEWEARSD